MVSADLSEPGGRSEHSVLPFLQPWAAVADFIGGDLLSNRR